MPKLLTIVIPAYNVENVINNALNSLDYACNKDFDVLVIDDGGSKPIKKFIEPWLKRYPNVIKTFRKTNGNWGSVVNYAAKHVKSTFVKILDADDTFNFTELSRVINYLKKIDKNTDIVLSSFNFKFDLKNNKTTHRKISKKWYMRYTNFDNFKTTYILTHHATIFNTKFLKNKLHIEEHFRFGDNILMYRSILYSDKIALLPKKSFLYEYHIGVPQQQTCLEQMVKYYHDAQKTLNVISQIKISDDVSRKRKKTLFILLKSMYYFSLVLLSLNKELYAWQKKINFDKIKKCVQQAKNNGWSDVLRSNPIGFLNSLNHQSAETISQIAFKLLQVGFIKIIKDNDRLLKRKQFFN